MSLKEKYAIYDLDFPEAGEVWEWSGTGPGSYLVLDNGEGDELGYVFHAIRLDKGATRKIFWNYENQHRWRRVA